jgi:hypothetical protein
MKFLLGFQQYFFNFLFCEENIFSITFGRASVPLVEQTVKTCDTLFCAWLNGSLPWKKPSAFVKFREKKPPIKRIMRKNPWKNFS